MINIGPHLKIDLASKPRLVCLGDLADVLRKVCLFIILLVSVPAFSENSITVERDNEKEINQIKSAYLYNFLKYVDLQPSENQLSQNVYSVCVFGNDPFKEALDALVGRQAKGATVKIKRTRNQNELLDCHILYISQSEKNNIEPILKSIENHSILTVSDIKDFTLNGGIIRFSTSEKKIGIEINLSNAIKAKVRISALLLEIAKLIE